MSVHLHIVEPTLNSVVGHCHALVHSLVAAAPECKVTVWGGRSADLASTWSGPGDLKAHFNRRLRRVQAYWLYRRLLRQPGRILVSTAGSADLVLADWAASGPIAPKKLFLFVHWLNAKVSKMRMLSAIARRQPNIEILAPTQAVASFFASCGFAVTAVPYPLDRAEGGRVAAPAQFRHLLVAGGARMDKGFDRIVDLVVEMKQRGLNLPILVQTSLEYRHRDDPDLAHQIARLHAAQYAGLTLCEAALSPQTYRSIFDGSIVLQPYRADQFKDRVSGVTLDALAAASPVIVTDGTWMSALVRRFDAGVAIADLSAASMLQAVERVLAQYPQYNARALAAAERVQAEHSARRLLDIVLQRN
jgi:glycosyltransferase involved in cell wall biosynthesis